jgi:formate hydrogenlyase subunit 4
MTWTGLLSQLLEIALAIALAPLLTGWVNQWRAWLQNKSAPGIWQPYRLLHKLFNKESLVADNASRLFRVAPYVVFGCMLLASAIGPTPSRWLACSPWPASSSRSRPWTWAPPSARWGRGARC